VWSAGFSNYRRLGRWIHASLFRLPRSGTARLPYRLWDFAGFRPGSAIGTSRTPSVRTLDCRIYTWKLACETIDWWSRRSWYVAKQTMGECKSGSERLRPRSRRRTSCGYVQRSTRLSLRSAIGVDSCCLLYYNIVNERDVVDEWMSEWMKEFTWNHLRFKVLSNRFLIARLLIFTHAKLRLMASWIGLDTEWTRDESHLGHFVSLPLATRNAASIHLTHIWWKMSSTLLSSLCLLYSLLPQLERISLLVAHTLRASDLNRLITAGGDGGVLSHLPLSLRELLSR